MQMLLLGWCASQRDLEVIRKILQQVCAAYGPEGGTTVVVLTQRSKLEMEATFGHSIPEARRQGSRFIFRQGSPLVTAGAVGVATSCCAMVCISLVVA